jgi:hypothetical protein
MPQAQEMLASATNTTKDVNAAHHELDLEKNNMTCLSRCSNHFDLLVSSSRRVSKVSCSILTLLVFYEIFLKLQQNVA